MKKKLPLSHLFDIQQNPKSHIQLTRCTSLNQMLCEQSWLLKKNSTIHIYSIQTNGAKMSLVRDSLSYKKSQTNTPLIYNQYLFYLIHPLTHTQPKYVLAAAWSSLCSEINIVNYLHQMEYYPGKWWVHKCIRAWNQLGAFQPLWL